MHGAVCQRSFRSSPRNPLFASRTTATVARCRRRSALPPITAYKVDINFNGRTETLEVAEDQTILEVALEQGIELSHDCKMGVCMTCPAKLVSGRVDQTAGMLDEDVQEKGYALLCVAQPQSDCTVQTIEEEELLAEVMHSGAL
ncbi:TPA: hypothetical protein ACH3X2_010459 [Trebouxia sp. C0005]|nr:MAG: ferredoxin- chloroplastic-like [Trebouxia sp. A1-2]